MLIPHSIWLAYAPLPLSVMTYSIPENMSLCAMWVTMPPSYCYSKRITENVASGLFNFCSHNSNSIKRCSFQATYIIKEINSMVQRFGATPFVAMMETLGVDSSTGSSFVQGNTEFCFIMQNFEKWFSTLAIH